VEIVDQFREIAGELPKSWRAARLHLTVFDDGDCARAAALLGPANPGRRGKVIDIELRRDGIGVDRARELLRRLDAERIKGSLALIEAVSPEPPEETVEGGLASAWDEAVAALPDDWSDLYAEVELPSTDYVEPGALLLSPLNPRRTGPQATFRFRVARTFGYGAASEMVRRCFERLDESGITGKLRIVNAFSDSYPVRTQGPVWYSEGKVV
jgi:hypothetical protein